MIKSIQEKLEAAYKVCKRYPQVMVMGALGRCGTGACDLAVKVGIPE
jgi:saccharopine dehydrogenase (NAD+, L-lysine-forming)